MSLQEQLNILRNRYESKVSTPKNIKSPGVCKKLLRQIRNMEKKILATATVEVVCFDQTNKNGRTYTKEVLDATLAPEV